jgi:hypothetical protein
MDPLKNTFFGFIPRQTGNSLKDSGQCLCDWCSTRLRKHDGYLNVISHQFVGPLDNLTNAQKDEAIANHGMISGMDYDAGYGQAFHGKLLPNKRPFGRFNHPMSDPCSGGSNPAGCRHVNAYRESTQVCERGGCCADDCREYGDALERYLECREKCPKQDIGTVTQMCGPPPINPALNGCKKN